MASTNPDRFPEHSLQEREYRDREGQLHNHTNVYMNQHRKEREASPLLTGMLLLLVVAATGLSVYRASLDR